MQPLIGGHVSVEATVSMYIFAALPGNLYKRLHEVGKKKWFGGKETGGNGWG